MAAVLAALVVVMVVAVASAVAVLVAVAASVVVVLAVAAASVAHADSKENNNPSLVGEGLLLGGYSAEASSVASSSSGSLKSVMPASMRILYQVMSFLM